MEIFARLKTRIIKWTSGDYTQMPIYINSRHIVIDVICPEISEAEERKFKNINLKPYGLAVSRVGNSDYKYDVSEIDNPGVYTLKNMEIVAADTNNVDNLCVVILSYVEFDQL